jgi:hypothetical protein
LRCIGGALERPYAENASSGVAVAPAPGDPAIAIEPANLGDPIAHGRVRPYSVDYPDPSLSFCPAPISSTFNTSQAISILG